MTRGRRKRIGTGIYRDAAGIAICVSVNGHRLERRYPPTTPIDTIKEARKRLRRELEQSTPPPAARGSFTAEADRYLSHAAHLAAWKARRSEIRAWIALLGRRPRATITRADILAARSEWSAAGVNPKTINNRLIALRAMYHALDGDDAASPADRIKPLPTRTPPAHSISADLIGQVYQNLSAAIDHATHQPRRSHHRTDRPRLARLKQVRARLRILAVSGVRPSELMRAQPEDFDLDQATWTTRDGKGGHRPQGIPITPAVDAAIRELLEADALGPFDTGAHAQTLRRFGWPAHIRPYNLRHSLSQALSTAGADIREAADLLGHRRLETHRRHYNPGQADKLRAALARLDTRIDFLEPAARAQGT